MKTALIKQYMLDKNLRTPLYYILYIPIPKVKLFSFVTILSWVEI